MRVLSTDDECPAYEWAEGEQIVPHGVQSPVYELRPIELHMKVDGDINDEPSFAFVLTEQTSGVKFVAQISLKKMMPAIYAAQLYLNQKSFDTLERELCTTS